MQNILNLDNSRNIELETLLIYDLVGRLVKSVDLRSADSGTTIDVSLLPSATYVIVISGKNGRKTELLIKE